MKGYLLIFMAITILTFTSCSHPLHTNKDLDAIKDTNEVQYPDKADYGDKKDTADIKEHKGIFTDTIVIGSGGEFQGIITKYKLSKDANINFSYYINDSDEKAEFLGSEVYMAPMLINMFCRIFPMALYDPVQLENLTKNLNDAINDLNDNPEAPQEDSPSQDESEILNKLEGYKINIVVLTFYDEESGEKIAQCSSRGKDDLDFKKYRDYDPEKSLFGAEIGVFEE
jgi:hypothetical protein